MRALGELDHALEDEELSQIVDSPLLTNRQVDNISKHLRIRSVVQDCLLQPYA
jgi:hypothetical protein